MAMAIGGVRDQADDLDTVDSVRTNGSTARLGWIDAIRGLLTVLVVAQHAGQPYGGGGDWPVVEMTRSNALGVFFAVNAAFFMGLFFLIAAYFFPVSCDRKGPGAFVRDRALRLGFPLVAVGLGVFGFIAYLDYQDGGGPRSFWSFFLHTYVGQWQVDLNHLWFLAHLLVYAGAYALWRQVIGERLSMVRITTWMPGHRAILLYTFGLAAVTYVVRIWYPIDHWTWLLGVVPSELAHLPQYLSLFVIGLAAARGDWLRRFPTATGLTWLGIGLAAAAVRYIYTLWPGERLPRVIATGGGDWRSLVWSMWEALICVGLCIGLLTLAREACAQPAKWLRILAANSYVIYVLHVFVLVGLQTALVDISIPPLAKFALVTLVGVPLTMVVAMLVRWLMTLLRRVSFRNQGSGAGAVADFATLPLLLAGVDSQSRSVDRRSPPA